MNKRSLWLRILVIVGALAFAVGTLDPMEGSVVILAGCGLLTLGTCLGEHPRPMRLFWLWVFGLMLTGVAALWGLSALGGVGGQSGRSMWWLLLCVPYPAAWLLAFAGIIVRIVRWATGRGRREGAAAMA